METDAVISQLLIAACTYNGADPARNQHLLKVHNYCRMIAFGEKLDAHTQFIVEAAAVLHDIGIHEAERIHGSSAGAYQQMEGPAIAREILADFPLPESDVTRICWLIAHHHTYRPIDGIDHLILLEADFLVNAYEEPFTTAQILHFYQNIAATKTGKALLKLHYLPDMD
ncbi:MAG: HD domain-containing protein [Eubacteriales bacterium]|nr:HD domain-containing protein [Eubacteriales bacterium]